MSEKETDPYHPPQSDVLPDDDATLTGKRIQVVPIWIMVASWIFLFGAVLSVVVFIYLLFFDGTRLFFNPGLLIAEGVIRDLFLFLLMPPVLGIGAYGLLYGKAWGAKAALVAGYAALVLVLWPLLASPSTQGLLTRYELPLLLLYLFTLHRIQGRWSLDR